MKIALQLGLIPGSSVADKAKWAADNGVEGIELGAFGVPHDQLYKQAEEINGLVPISSVCGNSTPDGTPSFHLVNPDKDIRKACIEGVKSVLTFCGSVGAVGQIVPPIFGNRLVPDLSPFMSGEEVQEKLMVAVAEELGLFAAEKKTLFMLEPLNRYEQHYLRTQADGVRIIKSVSPEARKGMGLLSDFFHMHIEETNTPQAFLDAKGYTTAIHLADNTRQEPGTGDIDFVAGFKALKETGFDKYMAYECGISGDDKAASLKKSLEYVRDCISRA